MSMARLQSWGLISLLSLGVAGCAGRSDIFDSLVAASHAPPCKGCSALGPPPCTDCGLPPKTLLPTPADPGWDVWGKPMLEHAGLAVEVLSPRIDQTWLEVEASLPELVADLSKPGLARLAGPYGVYRCALAGDVPTPPVEAWALLVAVRAQVTESQFRGVDGVLIAAAMKRVALVRKNELEKRLPILSVAPTPEQTASFDAAIAYAFAVALAESMPRELRQRVLALASARVVSATPRLHGKKAVVTADTAGSPPAP